MHLCFALKKGDSINAQPKTKAEELFEQLKGMVSGDTKATDLLCAKLARDIKQLPADEIDKRYMLEVMLLCVKQEFEAAESKLLKMIKTVYWSSASVVNGCEALASSGYLERAYQACAEAFELNSEDVDVSMYLMRFSLGLGKVEEFEKIYDKNRKLLENSENRQVEFTLEQLVAEHKFLRNCLEGSGVSSDEYRKLISLSEEVAQKRSVKSNLISQFPNPEEGDLFINIYVNVFDSKLLAEMNDELVDLMISKFDTKLPNGIIQFLPYTEAAKSLKKESI